MPILPAVFTLMRGCTQVFSGLLAVGILVLTMIFALLGMTVPQSDPVGLGEYLS